MTTEVASLLEVAVTCARGAGALLRERFEQTRTIEHKGAGRINLVTDADKASEALIVSRLAERFPTHRIVAEESGVRGSRGGVCWFVDPLDGTTNYAHQLPLFCVTLGVEGPTETGQTALLAGVVYDPMRDELFTAGRGQGAFLNGRPLRVSEPASLDQALLCTGFPYDVHEHPEPSVGLFGHLVRHAQGMRRLGSAALDMAWVACGRLDGFFEFGLKPWDLAGASLVIAEAGGVVTRIDGEPFDVRCGDVLAAPPSIAGALQREVRAFLGGVTWSPSSFDET
jgi:myo-inositol-1(or 4)-monophosphatase